MKKRWFLPLVVLAGCGGTTTATVTTTTEAPQLVPSQACVAIGSVYEDDDPIISNLRELGYDLDYSNGTWTFEGEVVGESEFEDSAFDFCGERIFMEPVIEERNHIINAGGFG